MARQMSETRREEVHDKMQYQSKNGLRSFTHENKVRPQRNSDLGGTSEARPQTKCLLGRCGEGETGFTRGKAQSGGWA